MFRRVALVRVLDVQYGPWRYTSSHCFARTFPGMLVLMALKMRIESWAAMPARLCVSRVGEIAKAAMGRPADVQRGQEDGDPLGNGDKAERRHLGRSEISGRYRSMNEHSLRKELVLAARHYSSRGGIVGRVCETCFRLKHGSALRLATVPVGCG